MHGIGILFEETNDWLISRLLIMIKHVISHDEEKMYGIWDICKIPSSRTFAH